MDKYSLKTGLREQTILQDVYFTPPFNLVDVRENKKNRLLEVMVMSSSPGILNDDCYDITIEVVDGSALNLQTQSYQRIFVSDQGSHQQMTVTVGADAYFSHVPHPVVPHKGACNTSKNIVRLENTSTLLWADILTCGRKHMAQGERFQFSKYHAVTEIYQQGVLIFKDNLYLEPDQIDLQQFGQYERYTHQGSLFYISPSKEIDQRIEGINQKLTQQEGISFGLSKVLDNAFILRVLGHEAEQLFTLFTEIRQAEDHLINQKKSNE